LNRLLKPQAIQPAFVANDRNRQRVRSPGDARQRAERRDRRTGNRQPRQNIGEIGRLKPQWTAAHNELTRVLDVVAPCVLSRVFALFRTGGGILVDAVAAPSARALLFDILRPPECFRPLFRELLVSLVLGTLVDVFEFTLRAEALPSSVPASKEAVAPADDKYASLLLPRSGADCSLLRDEELRSFLQDECWSSSQISEFLTIRRAGRA
jgi:hypothetical protein